MPKPLSDDYPSASQATVRVLSEAEAADWRREEGTRVVYHRGRFWQEIAPGFLEGVHTLARMSADEATRPTPWCWGYRATLDDSSASAANGSVPVFLVRDLRSYGDWCLPKRKRESLRQCLRSTQIVELTDSALLEKQGYEIYLSFAERLGVSRQLRHAAYLQMVRRWSGDSRRLVLAGLAGDRLLGYMESFAVEGTAYIQQVHVRSDALSTNISAGLHYEMLEAYRRSDRVREAMTGQPRPENPGLNSFKTNMGFEAVSVPTRYHMFAPLGEYIRRRRPLTYYHLTGREVPST